MQIDSRPAGTPALDQAPEPLTKDGALAAYLADPSEANRNDVVSTHYAYVRYQAEKVAATLPEKANTDADDLAQEGCFGLMDALKGFVPERGVKFETYALPRVRGAMIDALRKNDWVPRLVRQHQRKVRNVIATLDAELGREPSDQECATRLEISLEDFRDMKTDAQVASVQSMNKGVGSSERADARREKDSLFEASLSGSRMKNPLKQLMDDELSQEILRGLNETERNIFHYYVVEEKPMNEIGDLLDLSESRVSQMFSSIIERLQTKILDGLKRNDNSFIAQVAVQFAGHVRGAEMEFVPLPAAVLSDLDRANASNRVQFEFMDGPTEYQATDASEHEVEKIVAAARAKRDVDLAAGEKNEIAVQDTPDDDFGFSFT